MRPLQGRKLYTCTVTVGFTHGYSRYSPSGSMERSNLLASPWSNQWLTAGIASPVPPIPNPESLSFNHPHRLQPRHATGQAGVVDHFDDRVHILIGFGDLFRNAVARVGAHDDAKVFQSLLGVLGEA